MQRKTGVAVASAAIIAGAVISCSNDKSSTPAATPPSSGTSPQDSCRFATAAEIAQASGLPVAQAKDLGPTGGAQGPGCYYADTFTNNMQTAVVVGLLNSNIDDRMSKIRTDPQGTVRDVPGLGLQAKFWTSSNTGQYGGYLFVKANADRGFSVHTSQESREDSLKTEVAVAKVLVPRI